MHGRCPWKASGWRSKGLGRCGFKASMLVSILAHADTHAPRIHGEHHDATPLHCSCPPRLGGPSDLGCLLSRPRPAAPMLPASILVARELLFRGEKRMKGWLKDKVEEGELNQRLLFARERLPACVLAEIPAALARALPRRRRR